MLPSFKHRLAVYFLLLAVLPLTAAFWGFGTIAKRAEERRVDSRLGAELRAVFASYERQTDQLTKRARRLASRQDIQRGLRARSFGALPRGWPSGPKQRSRQRGQFRSGRATEWSGRFLPSSRWTGGS